MINTEVINTCLTVKWIWKLHHDHESMCCKLIHRNYLAQGDIFEWDKQKGSQFWRSLQKIKHWFKVGAVHMAHNGKSTKFWTDIWLGDAPLKCQFPSILCYLL